jgi:hypothetical protein
VYKSRYLGEPVLIKGYFPGSRSLIQIDRHVEANVKLHVILGDFIAWGEDSPLTAADPRFMVVIKSDDQCYSASSANMLLGRKEAKALQTAAIADLSKLHNFGP